MSEYRVSYNPYTKDYISGQQGHVEQIYNRGRQKVFDDYIRGIILDDVLYLRIYYPFEDIQDKAYKDILSASAALLKDNEKNIIKAIKKQDNITIRQIKYNVTNDLLTGLNLANI
jgi:hypothetical protein